MRTNPMLLIDFYKAVHAEMLPAGITKSVSYFTPRMSRIKRWNNVVMFGVQGFIKDYLINDSELAKINSNGGLRVGCNWYSKDEYKSEITKTFDKTSGTTYKFSHEDVKKIQDYINTNGIGNTKKADSLSTFYQKFLNK